MRRNAPEGVASIRANGGLEHYTEKSHKMRRLRSLPTDCCKMDLEVPLAHFMCKYYTCTVFVRIVKDGQVVVVPAGVVLL